ncbi:MAG TPA: hypothetical protein VE130_01905 [Nitrososphaeraceae archaeon]|nr:hypothetical protein [Nitrososphaeraceae archaeon]
MNFLNLGQTLESCHFLLADVEDASTASATYKTETRKMTATNQPVNIYFFVIAKTIDFSILALFCLPMVNSRIFGIMFVATTVASIMTVTTISLQNAMASHTTW